jgi:hypothetical protein
MKYRARGFLLRDVFPDVLKGFAIQEEFGDEYGEQQRNVTPTGNDALRERMAGAMGAAGIVKEPPPPPVDESVPDFDSMIVEQVRETLDKAAFDRGLSNEQYREVVESALKGKRLTKGTALAVWRAIQSWEAPEATQPAEAAPGAQETLL